MINGAGCLRKGNWTNEQLGSDLIIPAKYSCFVKNSFEMLCQYFLLRFEKAVLCQNILFYAPTLQAKRSF